MYPCFKKVIIKLSGEIFSSHDSILGGINDNIFSSIITNIKEIADLGVKIGLVVGGGNILRGSNTKLSKKISRISIDNAGMVSTIVNALIIKDLLQSNGVSCKILSSRSIEGIVESYSYQKVQSLFSRGTIAIFSGGTGNPLSTTDSAASLRAIEIGAQVILKATHVDGVYDKDPKKFHHANFHRKMTFSYAINNNLGVMDLKSFIECRDFNIPICVFNIKKMGIFKEIVMGNLLKGTWIRN